MRVHLGHAPGPLQPPDHISHPPNSTRNGPSRQHHRARTAASRAEQLVENEQVEKASEVEVEQATFLNSSGTAVNAGACSEKVAEISKEIIIN